MKRGKLRTVLLLPDKPILICCRKKLISVSESIFRDDISSINGRQNRQIKMCRLAVRIIGIHY